MRVNATEFKAKCLSLIDRVHATGEVITVTKRGRPVARLVGESQDEPRPWLALREHGYSWDGDPFAPVVDDEDLQAVK